MNIFDWIILIILVVFIFNGFRHGFLREVAGLIGVIVAFVLAVRLMDDLSVVLSDYLGLSPQVAVFTAAVGIFIVVLIGFVVIARMIRRLLDLATLGWVDRLLGLSFGLLKGAVIVSILALIISLVPAGKEFDQKQDESVLFHPVRKVAPFVFDAVVKFVPAANDFYVELKESFMDRSGEITEDAIHWLDSLNKKKNVDQEVLN